MAFRVPSPLLRLQTLRPCTWDMNGMLIGVSVLTSLGHLSTLLTMIGKPLHSIALYNSHEASECDCSCSFYLASTSAWVLLHCSAPLLCDDSFALGLNLGDCLHWGCASVQQLCNIGGGGPVMYKMICLTITLQWTPLAP